MANMHAVFAGHMVCYAVQVSDEQGVSRGSVKAAGRTTGRQVAALACVEALILSVACLYGAAVVCELEAGTLARIPLAGHLIEHDITFIRPKGSVFGDEYARLFDDLRSV